MKKIFRTKNTTGASLTEYGIIAGLVAVVSIGVVFKTGNQLADLFSSSAAEISLGAGAGAGAGLSADCFDPTNVGAVGAVDWTGCENMLIVDDAMLQGSSSTYIGGDGSFQITSGPTTFTYADSANNVFTGQVTDMREMFAETTYNGDIGYWNTSNTTTIKGMFQNNTTFNQDISSWDTSRVTAFNSTFVGAEAFNQDISSWDTSNSETFAAMFQSAIAFNQNIGSWDTSSVPNMNYMFKNATSFNQDLSGWCVSLIASPPFEFDLLATAWVGGAATRPQWNTCP